MKKGIIGLPKGTIGVVINKKYPRPEILAHTEHMVSWNTGRQRWVDIKLFEVISEK
tara:strand:+ start:295 stop:462 length:168 start_codon:yes stop_codon:yes gene_type:complete